MRDIRQNPGNPINLAPAKWIWFPSQRTLANTFILFRKELILDEIPKSACGWLTADSRYKLFVNGERVQWGPAPSDPRWPDVDPFDIADRLKPGKNIIGIEVLYFGHGDGTWVAGKPGMIFKLDIEKQDGSKEQIFSDESWKTYLDRAHRPGQYKRQFLRALQEEFDARIHPHGWNTTDYFVNKDWIQAMVLKCKSDKPSLCSNYNDYLYRSVYQDVKGSFLRTRQIPHLVEAAVTPKSMARTGRLKWSRNPLDWFEFRVPDAFKLENGQIWDVEKRKWDLPALYEKSETRYITFEFDEQIVGWPFFTIYAPSGTIIELMCQESHDPSNTAWLDTHFYAWSRFICKEGENHFEAFDFESLRWMQLHIHNTMEPVSIYNVGVRRRVYNWTHTPVIRCSEQNLQKLFNAGINTIYNSAQETIVDGMGRERQQYSGDVSHQAHVLRYAFGETKLVERFLRTYSDGLTLDGYFMDSWPGYDRMVRIAQRQIGTTQWGPIVDHGIGFVFDNWNHYFETGNKEALIETYPRLLKFAKYLESLKNKEGLLAVEDIGVPFVWIDNCFAKQRHKQCAFNLYAAAMYKYALSPLCKVFDDMELSNYYEELGSGILEAARKAFWSNKHGLYINNLPWINEEGMPTLDDRSLATALLFDQCHEGFVNASLKALAERPPEMGISYPPNACWRYWALSYYGRTDIVIKELRDIWANMESVILNNTIAESWKPRPDTTDQWSHVSVAPIYLLFMSIAGIRPTEPGYTKCQIRPQLGDIGKLELTAYTVKGPIHFMAEPEGNGHTISVKLPLGCEAELLLPLDVKPDFEVIKYDEKMKLKYYKLKSGEANVFSTCY